MTRTQMNIALVLGFLAVGVALRGVTSYREVNRWHYDSVAARVNVFTGQQCINKGRGWEIYRTRKEPCE